MSGNIRDQGRNICEDLDERYDYVRQLYDNMKNKWVLADYRIAIFELLDHGCFCPDCLFSAVKGEEE